MTQKLASNATQDLLQSDRCCSSRSWLQTRNQFCGRTPLSLPLRNRTQLGQAEGRRHCLTTTLVTPKGAILSGLSIEIGNHHASLLHLCLRCQSRASSSGLSHGGGRGQLPVCAASSSRMIPREYSCLLTIQLSLSAPREG